MSSTVGNTAVEYVEPERSTLLQALQSWINPNLVKAIKNCERSHTLNDFRAIKILLLSPSYELRAATAQDLLGPPADFSALFRAWDAAVFDFRRMVERREISLVGIEQRDDLTEVAASIPGSYASDMMFDFDYNTVTVRGRCFGCIVAIRGETVGNNPPPINNPFAAARARGQSSLDPLIREAVNDRWSRICIDGKPANTWSTMANWLEKHLRDKYQSIDSGKRIPSHGTIRTRLPRIYNEKFAAMTAQ